jgi:hypothetical protein
MDINMSHIKSIMFTIRKTSMLTHNMTVISPNLLILMSASLKRRLTCNPTNGLNYSSFDYEAKQDVKNWCLNSFWLSYYYYLLAVYSYKWIQKSRTILRDCWSWLNNWFNCLKQMFWLMMEIAYSKFHQNTTIPCFMDIHFTDFCFNVPQ